MIKKNGRISILFLVFMIFYGCENDPAEINALMFDGATDVEMAKEVEILFSDSAQIKLRITGPTMLYHLERSDPRQEFIDGVTVHFFGPDNEISSVLTANYAVRHENKAQVIARDSVVWESIKNEKLETEELIWDERSQKVYTKKFVVITRPEEIIYGYGFEANQDFSYSRINAIEGRLKVNNLDLEEEQEQPASQ